MASIQSFDALPPDHFGAILTDPPWRFNAWGKDGLDRSPDQHYSTMNLDDVCQLDVGRVAANDCALFMWVPSPNLIQALTVIGVWGFEYKTIAFVWMKSRGIMPAAGLGYWTRQSAEICLLATRGKPKRVRKDVRQGIIEPRRQHSRKPDCVHGRIEALVKGPFLEMFARTERAGWTCWGNQVGRYQVEEPDDVPVILRRTSKRWNGVGNRYMARK